MKIVVFFVGCILNLLALDLSAETNVASAMQPPGVVVRTTFSNFDEPAARQYYNSERATCGKAPLNRYSSNYRNGPSQDLAGDDSNSTSLPRGAYIVHGADQKYGEWPSFALLTCVVGELKYRCGGTLIGRRHILTAAHCMFVNNSDQTFLPQNVTVQLGKHNLTGTDRYEQVYNVSEICISRFFRLNDTSPKEDFAVLTLARNVDPLNDYVQAACLPSESEGVDTKRGNCWAVGAGASRIKEEGSKVETHWPDTVQKLQVVEISCRDWQYIGVKDNSGLHICFSKMPHQRHGATCRGDSGGPILCNSGRDSWTVVGITSFGQRSCDGPFFSDVYTNVACLESDIRSQCRL